jgi:hypothetical protein
MTLCKDMTDKDYEALGRAIMRGFSIPAMLMAWNIENRELLSFVEFLDLCEKMKQEQWLNDQKKIEQKRIAMLNPCSPDEHQLEILRLLALGRTLNSIASDLNIKYQPLKNKVSEWGYHLLRNKWIHYSDPAWQVHLLEEEARYEREEEFEKHIEEITDFIREHADVFIILGELLRKTEP